MILMALIWGQVALHLQWGDPRSQAFWRLHGAELRKSSAYDAPHAYTLLLNGADIHGFPYQTDNPRLSGLGDSAVCGCIRMDSIGPAFISFSYQRGGRMDPPESDDTLTLWGLNFQGQWLPLWQALGADVADTTFTSVNLFIGDPQWLHPCFRLKWSVWGSTYGAYDNWHIGYTLIRLDTSTFLPAWVKLPRIYDRRYGIWGVGYGLSDSVYGLASSHGFSDIEVEVQGLGQRLVRGVLPSSGVTESIYVKLPSIDVPGIYPLRWILRWTGTVPDSVVLMDTIKIDLNTWGYDDNEMESGYGVRQVNRSFCQVFRIDTNARIVRVGARFFPVPTQYGKPFQLGVWNVSDGMRPIYLKFERIIMDSVGGWQWFAIDTPLVVRGEVGIGFIQADNQPLAIGWDASCTEPNRVVIEAAGGWSPSQIEGCMMLRVELSSAVMTLERASEKPSPLTITVRAGETIPLVEGVRWPVSIWSMDGRQLCRELNEAVRIYHPGLFVCIDAGGRSWRLHVVP
ncbi:MAG: hypothetical protein N3E49_03370 [Bacteroidia bacterium]|nr:hypothetical protein [Bacteroidia bacterium]